MTSGMKTGGWLMAPDWVMLGMPLPDGRVRLLASTQLTRAELEIIYDHQVLHDGVFPVAITVTGSDVILTTHMHTCTVIDAPSYQDALNELFRDWKPPAPRRAIGEGQREVTA